MAKGDKLTQKDLMIWTMVHPNGTKFYYVIERVPFETEGLKKAVHLPGSTRDAVFGYRDQAEAVVNQFPAGDEAAVTDGERAGGEAEAAPETAEAAE